MKRFVISVIILIVIIFSSFSLPLYLEKTTTQLIDKIEDINQDVKNNNTDLALLKTQKFINFWTDKKDIITIFVNHKEIDNVTFSAARLASLLKYDNKSEFCSELNHIEAIIISIYNDDIPSFKNII